MTTVLALVFNVRVQETAPRLHPNGPGWRLECAVRDKGDLPRILLIGDSILNGGFEALAANGKPVTANNSFIGRFNSIA